MKYDTVYIIECKEDLREYLYELLGKDIECCLHFDKWNNSLMIETKEKSK